ncbi:hypothetical protein H2O64_09100 [Kordia sp. YSTF-M3]|uniref:Bacteriocin n=1 Tax=Kordia aestuariivivens TaxID=2759037 RepID=A0ABR7Q8D4_9FLAO|nr:hypothetical protein [Kordia aestuariivivens]MBC8754826.1 hypothetical protein [Kordia aestuariivivens]
MKKKDLKSLKLNKKSIVNFNVTTNLNGLHGGSGIRCMLPLPGSIIDCETEYPNCPGPSDPTDETMTCPDWSCGCPQN